MITEPVSGIAQLCKEFEEATKLHQILELASNDLAVAERDSAVVVDMSFWYRYRGVYNKCHVCLAGAVMRGRYQNVCEQAVSRRGGEFLFFVESRPEDLTEFDDVFRKLTALDALRNGDVVEAGSYMSSYLSSGGSREEYKRLDRYMPQYDGPNGRWWAGMKQLLADLKQADI